MMFLKVRRKNKDGPTVTQRLVRTVIDSRLSLLSIYPCVTRYYLPNNIF